MARKIEINTEFGMALCKFRTKAQAIVDEYYKDSSAPKPTLQFMEGPRYIRVVSEKGPNHAPQRSVYCFIDKTNGDVLKAAGWKAPAKHARGNIFDDDPAKGLGPFGAKYLR